MSNETQFSKSERIDKERIDALKYISKNHRKIHEGRINRELKAVITTISFYAACVAIKLKLSINNINDVKFNYAASLAIIIIAIFVYIYLKASGKSNNFNQALAEDSEEILLKSLGESNINNLSGLFEDLSKRLKDPVEFIKARQRINREYRPSANRWWWQAIIVISGAFIAIVLIDGLIIGIIFLYFIKIYILADYLKDR